MDKPKTLTLDYSKWRSGHRSEYQTGIGDTALLNNDGFMCCLGQWCKELGAIESELKNNGEPREIKKVIFPLTYEWDYVDVDEFDNPINLTTIENTSISVAAMGINDNEDTTPDQKIASLTELLATEGIELIVINKPV